MNYLLLYTDDLWDVDGILVNGRNGIMLNLRLNYPSLDCLFLIDYGQKAITPA